MVHLIEHNKIMKKNSSDMQVPVVFETLEVSWMKGLWQHFHQLQEIQQKASRCCTS